MASKLKNRLKEVEDKVKLNLVRAINRGLKKGRTIFIRLVKSEVNIKHAEVSKLISVKKQATRSNPEGTIRGLYRRQSLINFGAKKTAQGVKVRVSKDSTGSLLSKAFIAGQGNNKRVVIRRSNGKLKTLYSANVEQVLRRNYPTVLVEVEDFVEKELKRLNRVGL